MKICSTKIKGDIGLTQVIADLTKKGYYCALPISEHLPFDLGGPKMNFGKDFQDITLI